MKYMQAALLSAVITDSDQEMAEAAAEAFAAAVELDLRDREFSSVIIALGAAQDLLFAALCNRTDIEWHRLDMLHIDTYLGFSNEMPESGAARLQRGLLDHVKPRNFFPMFGDFEPIDDEIARYTSLLDEHRPAVCIVGIGENGHVAFNDPPADFNTDAQVHVEPLSPSTRALIERAGIFNDPAHIPRYGLTMTMPAIARVPQIIALVNEPEKAAVVKEILDGPVTPDVPASLLQTCPGATVYIGPDAATALSV